MILDVHRKRFNVHCMDIFEQNVLLMHGNYVEVQRDKNEESNTEIFTFDKGKLSANLLRKQMENRAVFLITVICSKISFNNILRKATHANGDGTCNACHTTCWL